MNSFSCHGRPWLAAACACRRYMNQAAWFAPACRLAAGICVLVLSGCAFQASNARTEALPSVSQNSKPVKTAEKAEIVPAEPGNNRSLTQTRRKLVLLACSFEGRRPGDTDVPFRDCSGFIRYLYRKVAGTDPLDGEPPARGGTQMLYNKCRRIGTLHGDSAVMPGDIIFFRQTLRRKTADRKPSHTGIVVAVEKDGTVEFLHVTNSLGVSRGFVNLSMPSVHDKNGKTVNSYIRKRRHRFDKDDRLAGELFLGFGYPFEER